MNRYRRETDPRDLTTTRYIVAAHIHDAHCDDAPCYDATIEQHRKAPTADDYARADRLLATLIAALTQAPGDLFGFDGPVAGHDGDHDAQPEPEVAA